jgi:hypothetical protein
MVEWTKHFSVFGLLALPLSMSTEDSGGRSRRSAHKLWSGRTLTSRRKTFPNGFWPNCESLSSRPGFDYRPCGSECLRCVMQPVS